MQFKVLFYAGLLLPAIVAAGGACEDWEKNDPTTYEKFIAALNRGDGNTAAIELTLAGKQGHISSAQAKCITSNIQVTANDHGGGKVCTKCAHVSS
ncbi:hypothetical protein N431DRAFT_464071 [Stipitochalara longipes BDJ]|nr:hypothetical protein N431DRAFT_464071 [Stipitochalara longipes BDJ]